MNSPFFLNLPVQCLPRKHNGCLSLYACKSNSTRWSACGFDWNHIHYLLWEHCNKRLFHKHSECAMQTCYTSDSCGIARVLVKQFGIVCWWILNSRRHPGSDWSGNPFFKPFELGPVNDKGQVFLVFRETYGVSVSDRSILDVSEFKSEPDKHWEGGFLVGNHNEYGNKNQSIFNEYPPHLTAGKNMFFANTHIIEEQHVAHV